MVERKNRIPMVLKRQIEKAPHHFALLEAHMESTQEHLDERRRVLAMKLHPDRFPEDPDAHMLMAKVNVAHSTLSNGREKYATTIGKGVCLACKGKSYTVKRRGFKQTTTLPCETCLGSGRKL